MRFDWASFFTGEAIPYRTSGKNVKRGQVHINCPLCGDDNSNHLGCNPDTGRWGCWRNPAHRGKDPTRLLIILGKTPAEAAAMVEDGLWAAGATIEGLTAIAGKLGARPPRVKLDAMVYPPGFMPPAPAGTRACFWSYLATRGFPAKDIPRVIKQYGLQCALGGRWHNRLILPFYYKGRVVGWTGRSIDKREEIRYKSEPKGDGVVKQLLYNYDGAAKGGKALVVVEGPLDTVKLDYYGQLYGVRTVSLLGVSATERQVTLLYRLAALYPRLYVCLDPTATGPALYLMGLLAHARPRLTDCARYAEDPGALTPAAAREYAISLVS